MWWWVISPFYDFCSFWYMAVNTIDKLHFLSFIIIIIIIIVNGKPWEPVIFAPPRHKIDIPQLITKNLSQVIRSTTSTAVQNLVGGNTSMGGFGTNRWIINYISFFIYTPFLSNTPTGQTADHIFTLNGSNDADSRKGVPFWLRMILQPI